MTNTLEDQAAPLIVGFLFCLTSASGDWYRWYAKIPNDRPSAVENCFYILFASYCIFRLYTIIRKIRRVKLARDGEKVVGQYLEILRAKGYCVFHDVLGKDFNVDHVIVGPQGIFTIETKTYSKPIHGAASIYFDGESISVNGYKIERNPIVQASAQSRWLGEQIQAGTGRIYPVKPVVVFPGWFVNTGADAKNSNVWVLNPKALPKFIDNLPTRLRTEEVQLIAYHISRYIRTNHRSSL